MINRVREFREGKSLTQAGLADRLGISRQSVNAIETGRYDPSLPIAFALARVFETTIEGLFEPGR